MLQTFHLTWHVEFLAAAIFDECGWLTLG